MTSWLPAPGTGNARDRQDAEPPYMTPYASSLRQWPEVKAWADRQVTNPSQDWTNLCQSFARQAIGAAAWAPSAWDAWRAIPSKDRRTTSPPPAGAIAYYGTKYPGHAVPVDVDGWCWSNDIKRRGKIDRVRWDVFVSAWSMPYLGWITACPSGVLNLAPTSSTPTPPAGAPAPAPTPKDDAMTLCEVKYGSNNTTWWLVASSGMVNVPSATAKTWTGSRLQVTDEATWRRMQALWPVGR